MSLFVKYVCISHACLCETLWISYADTGVGQPVRGLQDTPASSECRQLCSPQALFGHCSRVSSLPVQRTSSSHTWPEPLPKCAWPHALATPLYRKKKRYRRIEDLVLSKTDTVKSRCTDWPWCRMLHLFNLENELSKSIVFQIYY